MKKTIIAVSVAAIAGLGLASGAFAGYDLKAECQAAVTAQAAAMAAEAGEPAPADLDLSGCDCMADNTTDEITASFESASTEETPSEHWSDDGNALIAQCFPAPEGADAG